MWRESHAKEVTVKGGERLAVTTPILRPGRDLIYNGGDDSREDPPVPIPNTEVKLCNAKSS